MRGDREAVPWRSGFCFDRIASARFWERSASSRSDAQDSVGPRYPAPKSANFREDNFSRTIQQLRNPHGQIVWGDRWNNFRVADRSGATGQITNQNPKRPATLPPASPKLIRYFGDAGLGTGLLLRPSHRGSAQADAADGVLADFDRNAAGERNDVGKHSLPG